MNDWIVPLAGLLVYLFFCPGCFVWVWLHNRRADARSRAHLLHDSIKDPSGKSPLGVHLASTRKGYGLVKHSAWFEMPG